MTAEERETGAIIVKPKLKVTQVRSAAGKASRHRRVLEGLGLKRPHQTVVVANQPSFRGMVKKVIHLVDVEETDG